MWWSRVHKLSACHIVYAVRKKGPSVVLCTFDSSHSRNVFCRIVTGLKREKVWFYVLAVDVEPSQGFPTVLTDTGGWTWPVNSSVVKVWAMLTVFLWTLALVTRFIIMNTSDSESESRMSIEPRVGLVHVRFDKYWFSQPVANVCESDIYIVYIFCHLHTLWCFCSLHVKSCAFIKL